MDSLNLTLLLLNAVTSLQAFSQEVKLRGHLCWQIAYQGAFLVGILDLELHSIEQLLQFIVFLVKCQILIALNFVLLGQLFIAFLNYIELLSHGRLRRPLILDSLLQSFYLLAITDLFSRSLLLPASSSLWHYRHCASTIRTIRRPSASFVGLLFLSFHH